MFDKYIQVFIMHAIFLLLIIIYLVKKAQIALLIAKEVQIPIKYLDFSNVFSEAKVLALPEITDLNQYAIKLEKDQQSLYKPIYSLGLINFKTLKTYSKINLANGFILLLKSPIDAFIFFV